MLLHESGLQFNLISVEGESIMTNLSFNLNLAQLKGISPPRDFFRFFFELVWQLRGAYLFAIMF